MGYAQPAPQDSPGADLSTTAFVRDVYATMFMGLAMAAGGAYTSAFYGSYALWTTVAWAGMLLILVWRVMRPVMSFPLFTTSCLWMGALTGLYYPFLAANHQTWIFWQALGITTGAFGGLTAYVWVTKRDFGGLGGILFMTIWGMIVTGFMGAIFGMSDGVALVRSFVGLVMVVGYVLYDTSNVIRNRYARQDVYGAAFDLVWDFLYMMGKLIEILARSNKRK